MERLKTGINIIHPERKTLDAPPLRRNANSSEGDVYRGYKKAQKTNTECYNHPDKRSKYRIVSEDLELMYCEKCAILMASQGFKVEKLDREGSDSKMVLK